MDRSGLASVFLLLFLILLNFSDASLISNYRKFYVMRKDSSPGLSVDNKSVEKTVNGTKNGDNKLDLNEPSKETKLGSETENKTSKEAKKLDPNEVIQTNKDNKSDSKIVKEGSEKPKPGSEPENLANKGKELDSGPTENKPSKGEKPVENPKKEESGPEKKQSQSQENEKPSSELKKDESKEKKPDPKPATEENRVDPEPIVPKDVPVSKSSSGESAKSSPPPVEKTMKKEEDSKEKSKDKAESGTLTDKSCDALNPRCEIQKDLIGCIESSGDGSQVIILVQNKGESDLKANVAADTTGKGPEYNIPKKQSKIISVPVKSGKISGIVLHGADSKCELRLPQSAPEDKYLLKFPTYDNLVTPVNGAYLLIFSAIIFGATFACIKLSRNRRLGGGGGIPYQELEMGIPESGSAADLETAAATAEGWDEGWDDDWDNESSVKSAATRLAGNISANGLTSRAPNKDGWDDNWDD